MRKIVLLAIACGAPSRAPAIDNHAAGPAKSPYLGAHVKVREPELGVEAVLPAGLTLIDDIAGADGVHLMVAKRDADLVVLLISAGDEVVVDVAEVPGGATDEMPMSECSDDTDDVRLGLAAKGSCNGASTVPGTIGWNVRDGHLVTAATPITCTCFD